MSIGDILKKKPQRNIIMCELNVVSKVATLCNINKTIRVPIQWMLHFCKENNVNPNINYNLYKFISTPTKKT